MHLTPTVFLVDDHLALHDSLRTLLSTVGLSLEGYTSATEFLERHNPDQPGCLLLDVRMPGMSGLELQAELRRRGSPLPILFITGHADVQMAVQTVQNGAFAFLEKPYGDQQLLDQLHRALRQDTVNRALSQNRKTHAARLERLSAGERQVLDMIVEGYPNKVMAARLNLSEKTIEFRRARVMEKMEADNLAGLIRQVLRFSNLPEPTPNIDPRQVS